MSTTVLVLNGPNLDRLGKRQPEVYGSRTLADIEDRCRLLGEELGIRVVCHQSNHEGELVEHVHRAADEGWGVVVNAGAYTHTSIALRDALAEVAEASGFVEVHLSNVYARESFRHRSYLSEIARGVIAGMGEYGYYAALRYFAH